MADGPARAAAGNVIFLPLWPCFAEDSFMRFDVIHSLKRKLKILLEN